MATLSETDKDTPRQQEHQLTKDPEASNVEQKVQDGSVQIYRTYEEYMKMDHKPRVYDMQKGICLIINMTIERLGTDHDVKAIKNVFEDMNFIVVTETDGTKKQIKGALKKVARNEGAYDSVVCFILSHGDDDDMNATDGKLSFNTMFNILKESMQLAGKPKIWFIQACRGGGIDELHSTDFEYEDSKHKIPIEADGLYVFSTPRGYLSSRNAKDGTIFIQTLCDILKKKENRREKFLCLLPYLTDFIASKEIPIKDGRKMMQVIEFHSTLRGDLYFET